MGNIIKSFVIILAAASVSGGATYSFFSASDTVSGNTISTAEIKLDAKGESSETTLAKPISAENLVPGQYTPWARGAIHNQSLVPVRFYLYIDNLDGAVCPLTNLTITTGHAGSDTSERARTIFQGSILEIAGSANRIELTGTPPFQTVGANITQVIQQRAQLDESADNGSQDQECIWDEVFIAESVAPEDE